MTLDRLNHLVTKDVGSERWSISYSLEPFLTAAGGVENRFLNVTGNVYPEVERLVPAYPHRGPRVVFRNRGRGAFVDVTGSSGPGATTPQSSRGAAFGDFDNDGDVDVLIMNMNAPPSLLRNGQRSGHHWLQVRLEGTRANRHGVGATVRVTAGGRTQARAVLSQSSYYSLDDLRLSFGLGAADRAERVEVLCAGLSPGTYNVKIFSSPVEYGTYHMVGEVQVNATGE